MARDPGTGSHVNPFRAKQKTNPIQAALARNYAKAQTLPHPSVTAMAKTALDYSLFPVVGEPFSETNVGKALLHGDVSGFKNSLAPPHGGGGQVNAGTAPFPIKAGGIASSIGRAARLEPRTVRYKGQTQQFPKSPSFITAKGQALLDIASERLSPTVDALRESKNPFARSAGTVLTPASSRGRVPKQAGRFVRKDARRRQAALAPEITAVKSAAGSQLPFRKTSPDESAQFWYAQLPPTHRNGVGLSLVRGKLAEEQTYYSSGRALTDLQTHIGQLKQARRAASKEGNTTDVFRLTGQIEDLNQHVADIPQRVNDIGTQIKKLDVLIAKPPKVNEAAIGGLSALDRDRTQILVNAGKLDPEKAIERRGLLARFVGLEPTGSEVYIGHRSERVPFQRPSGLPGGVSVGATKTPQGAARGHVNHLTLVKSGRVRQDVSHVAMEDWQAAQVFDYHNIAKNQLARMGEPIVGRPKPGYVIVNPRGQDLPRTWKTMSEGQAAAEGFDPNAVIVADAEEYLKNYLAVTPQEVDRMLTAAADAGHLQDLRQVPADVVRRYYSQFLPTRILAATPGVKQGAGVVGKAADVFNDALYASLIYSNPGYIPANAASNLLLAGLHQGAFLPLNLMRAGQVIARAPERLKAQIYTEVGTGSSDALASGTSPLRGFGHVMNAITDNPFRVSAFIHEAARVGVISKTKPLLTKDDFAKLERFASDPKNRAPLNDVADRGVQAMVDFERMGSVERAFAKRLLFTWGWIRGAARWPLRFAADHPIRTAFITYEAYQHRGDIKKHVAKGMPAWLSGALNVGTEKIDGNVYPRVLPTTQLQGPLATTYEIGSALANRAGSRAVADYLNPAIGVALNVAGRKDQYGNVIGYGEALKQAGERLAPDYGLARDLVNPPSLGDAGMYPGDTTRLGRLERASRVYPYPVDTTPPRKRRKGKSSGSTTNPFRTGGSGGSSHNPFRSGGSSGSSHNPFR